MQCVFVCTPENNMATRHTVYTSLWFEGLVHGLHAMCVCAHTTCNHGCMQQNSGIILGGKKKLTHTRKQQEESTWGNKARDGGEGQHVHTNKSREEKEGKKGETWLQHETNSTISYDVRKYVRLIHKEGLQQQRSSLKYVQVHDNKVYAAHANAEQQQHTHREKKLEG